MFTNGQVMHWITQRHLQLPYNIKNKFDVILPVAITMKVFVAVTYPMVDKSRENAALQE